MPTMSGIYDSYYVQPICKIKDNMAIYTNYQWSHYLCAYQEPLIPGPAMNFEAVVASGATALAANATIQQQVVNILQLNDYEFLQVRFAVKDNVEGLIWEKAGQQKFASKNVHSRCDRNTPLFDPMWATTQFWILGINRDMNLEVRNPMGYAIPAARFQFWGIRYILEPLNLDGFDKKKFADGDQNYVRESLRQPTVWVPAEGRA